MQRVCEVCRELIEDEERWFRVRDEFVHPSCSEKYLKLASERQKQAKTARPQHLPETGH